MIYIGLGIFIISIGLGTGVSLIIKGVKKIKDTLK